MASKSIRSEIGPTPRCYTLGTKTWADGTFINSDSLKLPNAPPTQVPSKVREDKPVFSNVTSSCSMCLCAAERIR